MVVGCWFLAGLRGTIFRINPPITNNQRPTTVYPQSLDNVPVWDDRTWRTLAPLDSDLSTEVCVIGLGGSGLTAVSELLDLGRRVVGIDADDVAAGAAGRNGGGRDKAFDEEWTTANEHAPLGGERLVHAQRASRTGRIAARHVGNRRLLWNGQRGRRTLRAGRGAARQRRQQRIR